MEGRGSSQRWFSRRLMAFASSISKKLRVYYGINPTECTIRRGEL